MDYHLEGYQPGNPRNRSPHPGRTLPEQLPATADVLIVGCGPAGLMLGAQLAQFADLSTVIIDQKQGPLEVGQADGISGRSLEIFDAFGFSNRVLEEAYQLRAISFWRHDAKEPTQIKRHEKRADGRSQFSHFPHVVLNQARVHDFLLETMANGPTGLLPHYGVSFQSLAIEPQDHHPIKAELQRATADGLRQQSLEARYLVGCDGAHSRVRRAMGLELEGDSHRQGWGVMDLLLVTDFPDIRLKTVVESAREGTLMIIPREGGHLVRFYVELDQLAHGERIQERNITLENLVAAAQRILYPYTLTVKQVAWWSVYEVGQRLCPVFDNRNSAPTQRGPTVFIVGDACHTHSPKAGQGMNISMHDSFNLGWKLAAVAQGKSSGDLLLSYSDERHAIARELIDFDRHFASLFSEAGRSEETLDTSALQEALIRADGFVSGTTSEYGQSPTIDRASAQWCAGGLEIGKRFPPLTLLRAVDACPLQFKQKLLADGRWRLVVFDRLSPPSGLSDASGQFLDWLGDSPDSPLQKHTPEGTDIDSVIELLAVLPRDFRGIEFTDLPPLLQPCKGKLALRDYGKVFCPPSNPVAWYATLGIDPDLGCLAVVRPDQHVAAVFALTEWHALARFFARFMTPTHG